MKLKNLFYGEDAVATAETACYETGKPEVLCDRVLLSEHILDIYINDVLTMKLTCTADDLPELVLGRLLSEGVIDAASDVAQLYICEYGRRARVFLREGLVRRETQEPYAALVPTCCTGNQILNEDFAHHAQLRPVPPAAWSRKQVLACANRFVSDTPLHIMTRATHSCFLLEGEKIRFEAEDIGRHNALDKALGWAMLHDVDLSRAALFTSGRVPTDMATKVIRAGVPILISKETATKQAVELARQYGLTLIGRTRTTGFLVYTEAERKNP